MKKDKLLALCEATEMLKTAGVKNLGLDYSQASQGNPYPKDSLTIIERAVYHGRSDCLELLAKYAKYDIKTNASRLLYVAVIGEQVGLTRMGIYSFKKPRRFCQIIGSCVDICYSQS